HPLVLDQKVERYRTIHRPFEARGGRLVGGDVPGADFSAQTFYLRRLTEAARHHLSAFRRQGAAHSKADARGRAGHERPLVTKEHLRLRASLLATSRQSANGRSGPARFAAAAGRPDATEPVPAR